jgi:Ca2+-dependent lipid-binding protein
MNVNPSDRIIISLWDSDAFKKDDFMGQVILNYEDLVTPQEKWHRICSRHGHSDRVSGELKLSVTPTY